MYGMNIDITTVGHTPSYWFYLLVSFGPNMPYNSAANSHYFTFQFHARWGMSIFVIFMYGIFAYMWHKLMVNVGIYSLHGSYGH